MCLAEALLRVPDAETIDALIEDKIAPSDWGRTWAAPPPPSSTPPPGR
jgi:proline dehydrogenase